MQYHMFKDENGTSISVSAEIASSHLDLSVTRFNDLVRRGVISRQGRAKFDLDAVRLDYIRHLRDVAGGRKSDKDVPELTAERARLVCVQAAKAEIELAVLEGTLVPAQKVEKLWGSLVSSFRSRMIAIPGKFAHQISANKNPAEVEALLQESIYEALNELSQRKPERTGSDDHSSQNSTEVKTTSVVESQPVGG